MFGLKMYRMPFSIYLLLTLPVGKFPNDLGVVRGCIEAVKRPIIHGFHIIELVDGLRTEVNPSPMHLNPFVHVGG